VHGCVIEEGDIGDGVSGSYPETESIPRFHRRKYAKWYMSIWRDGESTSHINEVQQERRVREFEVSYGCGLGGSNRSPGVNSVSQVMNKIIIIVVIAATFFPMKESRAVIHSSVISTAKGKIVGFRKIPTHIYSQ
jgi:hypothetical protein